MVDNTRTTGSTLEFDDDWRQALLNDQSRYLVYPSASSGRQADLMEWIKVKQIKALLKQASIRKGKVLEYGCGAAGISLYLANEGYESHICDLSPYALQVAERNREKNAPFSKIRPVAANVLELPYATGSFDVVMSYGLLEHFEEWSLHHLLKETTRVLRPGGLFIADIVPGPERFNVRTLGIIISFLGSSGIRLLTSNWQGLRRLYNHYFDYYFETAYDDRTWIEILNKYELCDVQVAVCRPFPPLAISGSLEKLYTRTILSLLPFHQAFDRANNPLTRRWGWMYLASGCKAESN